jgi:hypothetical protein
MRWEIFVASYGGATPIGFVEAPSSIEALSIAKKAYPGACGENEMLVTYFPEPEPPERPTVWSRLIHPEI